MLFSKAFEMYEKELTAAVKQIRKQDKNDELVLLFEWLDLLHSSYPILTEREKSYREKTDAAMKAYLERENRASVDGKYKPIIRFFQEAMQKDDLILPRMVELRQENRYKTSKIVSGTKYIKRLARAERNTGKSYEDLYRERLQSFLERMDRTAQEAFWNTAEFKAMHNALKACAPSDPGKGQAEIRGGLKNLTQRVRAYLGKKSLDPFTQRGKDRLELARQLLNASQELLFEYEASAAMKKIEKDIVDGKPGHLALIDEKIDLCKEQLRKHLEEKSGERDLHSILDTDEFIRLFSRLEYLRVQRKNIEQGLLLPREIIILGTHQEDRGMDQEISPVLLQIETKEQLLALINSKEPVLRQKENGDWVSPAQQELEAFFQNIEPVSMRQEPGQGGQQAEEILIPLLEIRPEEELLPQQNVIDQDAQEERELLELLSAPRLKEEEDFLRQENPLLMDENPLLMDDNIILMDDVQEEEEWKIDPAELQMEKHEEFPDEERVFGGRLEDFQLLDDDLPVLSNKAKEEFYMDKIWGKNPEPVRSVRMIEVKENKIFEVITSLPAIIRTRQQALIREIPKEDFRTDAAFKEKFTLLEHLKLLQSTVEHYGNNREKWKGFDDLPSAVVSCFTVKKYGKVRTALGRKVDSYMKIVPDEEQLWQDINDPLPALKKYDKNAKQKVKEEKGKNSGAGKKQEPGNDSKKGKELKLV